MNGIIYKDYVSSLIPKNFISLASNIVVALGIVLFLDNFYSFALATMMLSLSGSSLLQITMEQDELSNFDKIQLTFPLTKRQIILTKYLAGLIMQGACFIISLLLALVYYWIGRVTLIAALQVWLLGIIIGLIFFSICYTGFYLLGNKRGSIMYIITMLVLVIGYLLTFFNFDVAVILTINHNLLLVIGLVVAFIILVLSFILSLKIYTKRYS